LGDLAGFLAGFALALLAGFFADLVDFAAILMLLRDDPWVPSSWK
jgi:hypothetical protein